MASQGRLLRNRVTEEEIRDYLQANGFRGPSARFDYVELIAIERPGWVQVFEFRVRVFDEDENVHHLLGVLRSDERKSMKIFLTESEAEQAKTMEEWSVGLITLQRSSSPYTPVLLGFFVLLLTLAVLGAVLPR